jgi:hypothetical protein
MKMAFKIDYIPEPKLMFMKGEALNPTVGLIKYGPRFSSVDEKKHKWIKVGIIWSSKSISQTLSFFEEMKFTIVPMEIKPWRIPFPSLNEDSPLLFSLSCQPQWQKRITVDEIITIKKEKSRNKRIEAVLELIGNKIKVIYEKSPPEIIVISLPEEIEELCTDPKMDNPLIKLANEDDFHHRIKVYGMKYKMPTQIIRSRTFLLKATQEKSEIAWNLAVGILYKSQKGYPWKLTSLEENTCYLGISFYKENEEKKKYMRASMAQLFLDSGESFILRGDSFEWDEKKNKTKTPHLSKENAKKLIQQVLKQYKEVRGCLPNRVVIHKTSTYWDDEFEGFQEGSKGIEAKDFITIHPSNIKFYRTESHPVLRGTLISAPNMEEHYLYTTGFVPCLDTYPGFAIPRPLRIRTKIADSPIQKICEEILSFTKLDWNNTFIYRKLPITIAVSRKVGRVLAESEAKNIEIDPHYYFYM